MKLAAVLSRFDPPEETSISFPGLNLDSYLPEKLRGLALSQTDIPSIARNLKLCGELEAAACSIPALHYLIRGDARSMRLLTPESVHLVLTSPPYWNLKRYEDSEGQLGHIFDYEEFLEELHKVWARCFDLLVPGGRLICVVGDVCLSRRQNEGRHTVVPLHASIQEICRRIGYDNLAPIIWHKIANVVYEVGGGAGFLGKPYEPNAVIKNDIEFILMQRKPGGYRKPDAATRLLSVISSENYQAWFRQIWTGITGAPTKHHPAPYPVELAQRLVRMFSFAGDVVLDPFSGSGTTAIAATRCGRNSIGYEINVRYHSEALRRIEQETKSLFNQPLLKGLHEA